MIARKNRFHGHRSVSRVRGSLIHSRLMSIRYAKNKKDDYRLAVVVSKKIDTRAVVRNRIRRRIYEAFRVQRTLEGRSLDVVVYVKSSDLANSSAKKLSNEIARLTEKVISSLR